jgi:hypothetical protein
VCSCGDAIGAVPYTLVLPASFQRSNQLEITIENVSFELLHEIVNVSVSRVNTGFRLSNVHTEIVVYMSVYVWVFWRVFFSLHVIQICLG